MSRRDFCAWSAACAAIGVAACVDSGEVVHTGPLGNAGDDDDTTQAIDASPPIDGSHATSPDAMEPPPDAMPQGPQCAGGEHDVGLPSTFAMNTPVLFSSLNFYVVRDAGGLFALSSRCTHEQAQNNVSSGHFHCPRHGANFQFTGAIISGPVSQPLRHYGMCILASGHVGVNTSQVVTSTTRLSA
jgi:nitrite reductase/ring-hydroxylating ferredoxin subunit